VEKVLISHSDCITILLDYKITKLPDYRNAGLLDYKITKLPDYLHDPAVVRLYSHLIM